MEDIHNYIRLQMNPEYFDDPNDITAIFAEKVETVVKKLLAGENAMHIVQIVLSYVMVFYKTMK